MTPHDKKFLAAVALGLSLVGSAHAVTLDTLLGGASLTHGNLVFDQWTAGDLGASDGRSFDAALIDVTALDDGGLPGLSFTVNQGLLSIAGDDLFAYVDLPIAFRATATGGMAINQVQLKLVDAFVTYTVDGVNDVGSYVHEGVGSGAGADDLGSLAVEFSNLDGAMTSQLLDAMSFAARAGVWIGKNTLTWAADASDSASLLSFEQRFGLTPAVPEPSTYGLMMLGLVALAAVRRARA